MSPAHLALNRYGIWEGRWSERVAVGAWKPCAVSFRTRDRAVAEEALAALERERGAAAAIAARPTVASVVGLYLADAERRGLGDAQARALTAVVGKLGDRPVDQLARVDFEAYGKARGVASGTVRRELGALAAAFSHAERHRVLHPGARPVFDLPAPGQARERFLDESEERRFWQLAQATTRGDRLSRLARFVPLAMDTAARRGAIEGLTWERVDLKARVVDYRDPSRAVTKKRRVRVPIADRLLEVLKRARWEADRDQLHPSAPVIGRGAIRKAYELWTEAPGFPFPWVTPHTLRHTWATLAARRGVGMWDIAGVLGDSLDTVTSHYLHHAPGHLLAAVNRSSSPYQPGAVP